MNKEYRSTVCWILECTECGVESIFDQHHLPLDRVTAMDEDDDGEWVVSFVCPNCNHLVEIPRDDIEVEYE